MISFASTALLARINASLVPAKQQRFLTPLLYQNGTNGQPRGTTGCVDITVGQNASHPDPGVGYQAQVGFNAVSGWGPPTEPHRGDKGGNGHYAVPEPSTLAMTLVGMGLGLGLVIAGIRRNRSTSAA